MGAWGYARGGMGAVAERNLANAFPITTAANYVPTPALSRLWSRTARSRALHSRRVRRLMRRIVVSAMDVKRTFLKVHGQEAISTRRSFTIALANFKIRGSSGKINIALDGMPTFPALPKGSPLLDGDMHFIDSMERMERAYDDWKEGTWSKGSLRRYDHPDGIAIPPWRRPGKALHESVLCSIVRRRSRVANGRPRSGISLARRSSTRSPNYSPDFKDLILHCGNSARRRILKTSRDLTEGNIFHGELTMDQLMFNRPIPGYAQYRGPVGGLYMCGSSNASRVAV